MAADEIHVNDIGTVLIFTIKDGSSVVDVSTATTKQIIFSNPSCSTVTKSGSFTTDGTDGKIQYTTVSGDLDVGGTWRAQAYIVIGGNEWHSDITSFEVHPNL